MKDELEQQVETEQEHVQRLLANLPATTGEYIEFGDAEEVAAIKSYAENLTLERYNRNMKANSYIDDDGIVGWAGNMPSNWLFAKYALNWAVSLGVLVIHNGSQ